MSREVCLPQDTRTFRQVGTGSLLGRTGWVLEAGSTIDISDPQNMVYDHRDQVAVSFEQNGKRYWLLVKEMNVPTLIN